MDANFTEGLELRAEMLAVEFRHHPEVMYEVSGVEQVLFVDIFLEAAFGCKFTSMPDNPK